MFINCTTVESLKVKRFYCDGGTVVLNFYGVKTSTLF